jgi:hypothetical protein
MKNLIPILALLAFLWSCDSSAEGTTSNDEDAKVENTSGDQADKGDAGHQSEDNAEEAPVFPEPDATGNFGAAVSAEGAVDISQLTAQLEGQDSLRVKVSGAIKAVCQAKGCWMTLPLEGEEELMVKFKDYAFFVPRGAAEKNAVIEGWAYKEVVSVDELRHYAEDEGLPQEEIEKITEPKERVTFMADGVIIE